MAKYGPHQLKSKSEELGIPMRTLVLGALERNGSLLGAARELSVTPGTVRYWLGKWGLKATTRQTVTLEREVSHE